MELEIYTVTKEEEYDAMAERLNLLAEALANVHPGQSLPKSRERNRAARELIQFFRRML
ncbi:hypothetical protein HUW51_10535 [Adhaeribacter swui]|uniref:Uncharacterized protein n=1 Tax=Adhaeribacter swui TaxID=2086471 RepID=A0A7G7G7K7_9BACT|nr:hypothetical protein [Adhaeribacter swui]QNF33141.1 hypothetical protein HUW51_10535 [Adhaeribacter swui]